MKDWDWIYLTPFVWVIGHPEDIHLYLGLGYSPPPFPLQSCLYPYGLTGALYYPGLTVLHTYTSVPASAMSVPMPIAAAAAPTIAVSMNDALIKKATML